MYNYFMLIGKMNGTSENHLELKVAREFGVGYDIFKIVVMDYLKEMAKEIPLGKTIVVKGRLIRADNCRNQLIAERIIFI